MGVFDDKKFDELDWISQATEPIDSQLNEILELIPEVVKLDFNAYLTIVGYSYSADLYMASAINHCIKVYCGSINVSQSDIYVLKDMFTFKADSEMIINFEDKTLTGNLCLVKLVNTMDEKVLANILGKEGTYTASSMRINCSGGLSRANDIMELLGDCALGIKTRSERTKRNVIIGRLSKLFKNNEWQIKDTELANKIGTWIYQYITDGNLAAYSNFCRLKVMTHKGQPIYSIQEVV